MFKVGDIVATKAISPEGYNRHYRGVIVDILDSGYCRVRWQVKFISSAIHSYKLIKV